MEKGKERKGKMWWLVKVGSRRRFSFCFALEIRSLVHQPRSLSHVAEGQRKRSIIHPTAIVHPNAVIGQLLCKAGEWLSTISWKPYFWKYSVRGQLHVDDVSSDLISLFSNTFYSSERGAVVGDDYPGCIIIGSNNTIGYHAVVGIKCQDMKYKPEDECFLEVGDNNDIREHTSIHRSSKSTDRTVIGNGNFIMGSCHIAHDCKIGNNNIFANNTLLAGHVEVEDYVHTAGATVVHQFCHLGSFSFLGGGSVVTQDVPKYMMVAGDRAELRGLNLVGLTRCGFSIAEVYSHHVQILLSSLYFMTTKEFSWVMIQIRSLRTAYRKIFMCVDANAGSFEERLAELVLFVFVYFFEVVGDESGVFLREQHEELVDVPVVNAMLQSIRNSFAEDRRGICKFRHWNVC
ncbi:putative acyl-[acyl-carrier-protein]--UDP-N-acetylglucosamine O-acyltransferase, mitochondrial, partial [Mucuna pruriens]